MMFLRRGSQVTNPARRSAVRTGRRTESEQTRTEQQDIISPTVCCRLGSSWKENRAGLRLCMPGQRPKSTHLAQPECFPRCTNTPYTSTRMPEPQDRSAGQHLGETVGEE